MFILSNFKLFTIQKSASEKMPEEFGNDHIGIAPDFPAEKVCGAVRVAYERS